MSYAERLLEGTPLRVEQAARARSASCSDGDFGSLREGPGALHGGVDPGGGENAEAGNMDPVLAHEDPQAFGSGVVVAGARTGTAHRGVGRMTWSTTSPSVSVDPTHAVSA